ncbi:MAG: selenocysteine-specific translation elongation factor [Betaproteobacteria bacterium]
MIVATAGHIDHGKTALVKVLTGVDTDRLPEEKARGISIDLGFAYLRTPGGATIGFVDVPGHERFVRNMLAGVCGIDLVLFVVAADDGIMPQTIEHLHIVELLSVTRGFAVITKADRVTPQRVEEVAASVRALLAPTGLAGIDVIPVSALTGDGIGAMRTALEEAAGKLERESQAGRRFRYAVDRVFSVAGSGTVVTGTVFNGTVAAGDRLVLSPTGIDVRVRGIQKDGKAAPQAMAGERCALNLTGAEVAQVTRGDWLVDSALHAPTQRIDARLRVLDTEPRPIAHWTPVHLHLGAGDVLARISVRRGASVKPGEPMVVQLVTDKPVSALSGDRFIIRDQSATRTLGGGVVLDPAAQRQRRSAEVRSAQLAALEGGDPACAMRDLQGCSPAGIDLDWFARIFNIDEVTLTALADAAGLALIGKAPRIGLPRASVEAAKAAVLEALKSFHAESPQAGGMEVAVLRRQCAPHLAAPTFAALLRELADAKGIEASGSVARLPRHVATDNPADQKLWGALQPVLEAASFGGLTIAEVAAAAKLKEPVVKDFLHRKAKTGETVRATDNRFYLRGTLAAFAAIASDVARGLPGGKFTAAQVRDHTGIGRGRAIEILECFDRLGITRRVGDLRVMAKDYAPILGAAPAAFAPEAPQRSAPT